MWILIYLASITAANLIILQFGPAMTPLTSFVLIGLDLVIRDKLTDKISKKAMFTMIAGAGVATYAINSGAAQIALASSLSFTVACLCDWSVFVRASGTWAQRSHKSNAVGSVVDSLLFPTIAFGNLMWGIVAAQIIAKMAGSVVWVWAIGENK